MAEMVRKLVLDDQDAPEQGMDLKGALDDISASILDSKAIRRQAEATAEAAAATAGAEAEAGRATLEQVDDPVTGRPISAGVLCFDEVQMMDIADATIVSGVLDRLFDAGWVLVATCNRTPEEFANSLLHRAHPQARFTARVLELCDRTLLHTPGEEPGTAVDYRKTLRVSDEAMYLSPLDARTSEALEGRFDSIVQGEATPTATPIAAGRSLTLVASPKLGVARSSFATLCGTALGAADYIALAQRYHTLFLTEVPQLSMSQRDQARRFITLVDQLYNNHTKLIATCAVPIANLFSGTTPKGQHVATGSDFLEGLEFEGEAGKAQELNPIGVTANSLASDSASSLSQTAKVGADSRKRLAADSLFTGEDEVFAFRRALSRLEEMQSVEYLARAGERRGSA